MNGYGDTSMIIHAWKIRAVASQKSVGGKTEIKSAFCSSPARARGKARGSIKRVGRGGLGPKLSYLQIRGSCGGKAKA